MKKFLTIFSLSLLISGCSSLGELRTCSLPEKNGPEIGYVQDVEHDQYGNELTGLALQWARFFEMFDNPPFCKEPG